MILSDQQERVRVLTELDHTLLVEAAAGTGKTSLIAGRVVMMMLNGSAPRNIAAITFTELAASELSLRIRNYASELLGGDIPKVMQGAITPADLASKAEVLRSAVDKFDELTACTIHSFCQRIIMAYAVETELDPGSRMMNAPAADAMFESVLSTFLSDHLSAEMRADQDPLAVLSKFEPLKVVKDCFDLAKIKLQHPGAGTVPVDLSLRKDIDFVEAVREFRRWQADYPKERNTAGLVEEFETLATFFENCFETLPTFAQLWKLADPPRTPSMKRFEFAFKQPKFLTAWRSAYGKDEGLALHDNAEAHLRNCETRFADLLGQIGDAMVGEMSRALNPVANLYVERKASAAVLDFDDLLIHALDLVRRHDAVRQAVGQRYSRILVDEFQDTDPIQAGILFAIAAEQRAEDWQDSKLRDGALFLVGDPKQSIYGFRGADTASYDDAKRVIEHLGADRIVHVGANFRCQPMIVEYVNAAFQPVLDADGQPHYSALTSTREGPVHGLDCVAQVTIDAGKGATSGQQRDEEASIVARICSKLVGAIDIEGEDGKPRRLKAGDIALLAPTGTELWRYERALEAAGLSVASQAGKTLFRQQETQDVLTLLRALSDSRDRLAFGALMRGPTVGLTDEELLDIAEAVQQSGPDASPTGYFDITTPPSLVAHPIARPVLEKLQALRRRVNLTTPRILLAEAIEQLQLRVVLAARNGNNRAARSLANLNALIELARPFDVRGLRAFVRHLQADWERGASRLEGRIDASEDAVEIVTIHSAKGLEWPVVIPINMATLARSNERFVHRSADNTLHWVIGNVSSSTLSVAREEVARRQLLEDQRKWYVACTRARDLLIVPNLAAAKSGAWSKILNLRFDLLNEIQFNHLISDLVAESTESSVVQDAATFERQAEVVRAAAVPLRWVNPSAYDVDRADALILPATDKPSTAFEYVEPIGVGRLRGLVLHKLMEELLTGELPEGADLVARSGRLTMELQPLVGIEGDLLDAAEMANTVLDTCHLPHVARLWSRLVPEFAIWAELDDIGALLSGRADAIAIDGSQILEVLDWKSDRNSTLHRAAHVQQMQRYLAAVEAPRGAIVYMTTGEIVQVLPTPAIRS
jgi:ATP-dependent exoDNAse (exonuclease V) beta subunit